MDTSQPYSFCGLFGHRFYAFLGEERLFNDREGLAGFGYPSYDNACTMGELKIQKVEFENSKMALRI